MTYTIQVTVEITTDTLQEAYADIRMALKASRKAEILHIDSEVLSEREEDGWL